MTDSSPKSVRYEYTPVSLVVGGIPLPAEVRLTHPKRVDFKRFPMRGLITGTISVNQAQRLTARLLRTYLKGVGKGRRVGVQDLLDIHPLFLRVPKVQEAWGRLRGTQRAKRRRGRPKGLYTIPPASVLGFVLALRASEGFKSDHQAIRWLARLGVLSYDRARYLYRAAQQDPGLWPLLLPRSEDRQILSAEEFARRLARAITAQPGQILSFALGNDGVARLVKVTEGEGEDHGPPN